MGCWFYCDDWKHKGDGSTEDKICAALFWLLHNEHFEFFTKVSGQPIGPIFKSWILEA